MSLDFPSHVGPLTTLVSARPLATALKAASRRIAVRADFVGRSISKDEVLLMCNQSYEWESETKMG
ncbi:hypothetical protein LINPERHAP2_LOCUS32499 [Linum perenne]